MAELCVKVAEFIVTLIRESLDLFRRIDSGRSTVLEVSGRHIYGHGFDYPYMG